MKIFWFYSFLDRHKTQITQKVSITRDMASLVCVLSSYLVSGRVRNNGYILGINTHLSWSLRETPQSDKEVRCAPSLNCPWRFTSTC